MGKDVTIRAPLIEITAGQAAPREPLQFVCPLCQVHFIGWAALSEHAAPCIAAHPDDVQRIQEAL